MLRIKQRAQEAFEREALEDFERRMVTHLRKFFPEVCTTLGEETLRRVIQYGVERARSRGFSTERAACIYLDVMFAFGCDFDRDPALPWAGEVLGRRDLDTPKARAVCLFSRAYEHRGEARGLRPEGVLS